MLFRSGRTFSDIAYSRLDTEWSTSRFIESGQAPKDGKQVDTVWQYSNVKGGPDRRFKNNRQLPVMLYDRLTLSSAEGLSWIIESSKPDSAHQLVAALRCPPPLAVVPPPDTPPPSRAIAVEGPRTAQPRMVGERSDNQPALGEPPAGRDSDLPTFNSIDVELVGLSEDGRLKVVGESHYQPALQLIANGRVFGTDFADHGPVQALLVPEPQNPFDQNAVRVDILISDRQSVKVGYLSRAVAPRYQPQLLQLQDRRRIGTCPGRLTGGGPGRYYGVYLHVAPPDRLLTPMQPLDQQAFAHVTGTEITLKAEWTCVVTGEEDHQVELGSYAARHPHRLDAVFTLDYCVIQHGKYRGAKAIEVRLEGNRIGELTKAMTDRYSGILDKVHAHSCVAFCHGELAHDQRRGWQVTLSMPRDPQRPRWS